MIEKSKIILLLVVADFAALCSHVKRKVCECNSIYVRCIRNIYSTKRHLFANHQSTLKEGIRK